MLFDWCYLDLCHQISLYSLYGHLVKGHHSSELIAEHTTPINRATSSWQRLVGDCFYPLTYTSDPNSHPVWRKEDFEKRATDAKTNPWHYPWSRGLWGRESAHARCGCLIRLVQTHRREPKWQEKDNQSENQQGDKENTAKKVGAVPIAKYNLIPQLLQAGERTYQHRIIQQDSLYEREYTRSLQRKPLQKHSLGHYGLTSLKLNWSRHLPDRQRGVLEWVCAWLIAAWD